MWHSSIKVETFVPQKWHPRADQAEAGYYEEIHNPPKLVMIKFVILTSRGDGQTLC